MKEQDKERRREHMVIIRQLENKKRNEERKKKIEDFKVRVFIALLKVINILNYFISI